jgi:DNA helicase-2/ATP-dependent DNA helicase PcrA
MAEARHTQILACAGSGKTETLARRIATLVAGGAPPDSIVAFTFTDRAARELKHRVALRVEERAGKEALDRVGPLYVGTIHAYCFRLLQTHVSRYGNYDVLDEHRHAGLLSREYKRLGLERLGSPRHWQPIRDFKRTVDVIANERIPLSALAGTSLGDCYQPYLEMLDRYHLLTFGLQIQHAVEALDDPAVFPRVHGPLRHLFVDEYQDINPAQEALIERLGRAPVAVTVVGDDDQSIYQWRGADIGNILGFRKRYAGVVTENLETNRRSRPMILAKANAFARSIAPRIDKEMKPFREPGEAEVVAFSAPTPEEEADQVAETIVRLHEKGFAWREIAVLFRSVRTSAPPLVSALQRRRVPFRCGGRTGLFLQPEAALLGELHAWFADGQWKDGRYEKPRPIDLAALVRGIEAAFGAGQPLPWLPRFLQDWKKVRLAGNQPVNLVGDLYKALDRVGISRIDPATPEGAARLGTLARFSEVLADFEHVTRRGRYVVEEDGTRRFRGGRDRGKAYAQSLLNYLLHYARDAYEDFEGEEATDLDAVDILTIHQAKGLEWPVVFLPSLVEGRMPSRRAGQQQEWGLPDVVFPEETRGRYEGSEAEERRLFYVALTRARDAVYLSCFERMKNRFRPSPFLLEVNDGQLPGVAADLPLPAAPGSATRDVPPLAVSFSEVAVFEDCGYLYRLANVLGFQQEFAVELGYGKAIHHVLRLVAERARADGDIPGAETLERLLADEFYLPFADAPTFERMSASARRLVERYLSEWSEDLRRIWDTERPFELHLADGTLAGRADVILSGERGDALSLAIVDYKTSNDPRREEHYALQLAIYAAAGRAEGLKVDAAYLHELAEGQRRSVDVSVEATAQAVDRVGGLIRELRAGRYEPRPAPEKCARCDRRRICRFAIRRPGD